jgi:hypothetical protein
MGQTLGLSKPADELSVMLESKYGKLLKSVPVSIYIYLCSIVIILFISDITNLNILCITQALRGASQIIDLAIETLRKDLPPPPPSPSELRQTESQAKQDVVTKLRLAAIRNRGKPISTTDNNTVGRL